MRIILYGGVGIPLGIACQSIAIYALHSVFMPQLLRDGQYVFLLVFAAPIGALLGILSGAALALFAEGKRHVCSVTLLASGVSCVSAALLSGFLYGGPTTILQYTERLFVGFGVPLLYSILLTFLGIFRLARWRGSQNSP